MSLRLEFLTVHRNKIVFHSSRTKSVENWFARGLDFNSINRLLYRKFIESYIITKEETYFVEN